jgi:hypothetical protein
MLIAAAFALPITGLFASMAWRWGGRRQVDHRPLLMILPVLAVGFWLLGYGAMVYVNGAFDRAMPVVVETTIEGKFRHQTGRTAVYRLNTDAGPFFVNAKIYGQARAGGMLRVATRAGRLDFAWAGFRGREFNISTLRRHPIGGSGCRKAAGRTAETPGGGPVPVLTHR